MERIRSALYVDFDNIFGGLLEVDRVAARAFAEEPARLIDRLGRLDEEQGIGRALLTRRAYLNPHGFVLDGELGNDQGRIYLSRFRPHLMRAGFEVIDCPALAARQKNAADIRMVLDVMDLLSREVRYDEVIIASSDADFTPLLLRLRSEDLRTMVLTAGSLSPPYRAVADRHIDESALSALLRTDDAASPSVPPEPEPRGDRPLEANAVAADARAGLPPLVAEVCAVADLPRLPTTTWIAVFEVLEEYLSDHGFVLAEATAWARDRLAERGTPVGRGAVSFVVRGCLIGGVSLNRVPAPSSDAMRTAFGNSMIERARSAGMELDQADEAALRRWLAGEG